MITIPGFAKDLFQNRQIAIAGVIEGIGCAIADVFAACGAQLLLTGRPELVRNALGEGERIAGNLADRTAIAKAADANAAKGPLAVLVNCAGAFLALPLAASITGTTLRVDGGCLAV